MSEQTNQSTNQPEVAEETKPAEINDSIRALAEKIKAGISIDKTTGLGTETGTPGKLFRTNLPKGITVDSVKEVNDYTSDFVAAVTLAAGEMSIDALKENSKLDKCKTKVKTMNRNVIETSVARGRGSKDYKHGEQIKDENGNVTDTIPVDVIKAGFVKTTYRASFDKNNGDLKKVRSLISLMAEEAGIVDNK